MSEERRLYPRFDLIAQVRVSGTSAQVDYVMGIVNISRGGALVDLGTLKRPSWVELGRRVDLRLFDPEGEPLVEARGRVVRIVESLEERTFAIEFEAVQEDDVIRRACISMGKPPPLPKR